MVLGLIIGFAAGLLVGWLFLPMPGFIAKWFGRETPPPG